MLSVGPQGPKAPSLVLAPTYPKIVKPLPPSSCTSSHAGAQPHPPTHPDCGCSDLCPREQRMVLRIVPVMGRGAHILNVTHNGIPVWGPRGSQRQPSPSCPGCHTSGIWWHHWETMLLKSKLGATTTEGSLLEGSLAPKMGGVEHHTHSHTTPLLPGPPAPAVCSLLSSSGCSRGFPLTALFFSASGQEESS